MKASIEYSDGRVEVIDTNTDTILPLIRYRGALFVLRAYVLGFIDNKGRDGGAGGNHYHETAIWNVDQSAVEAKT